MATISPTFAREGTWLKITWSGAATADTINTVYVNHNVSDAFIEAEGTFGSATVGLNGYVETAAATAAIADLDGTAIAITADGASAIRSVFPHMTPTVTGGTSDSIDIRLWLKVVK